MAKKAKVRPYEPGDARGVGELRARAFPYLTVVREHRFYETAYEWLGTHPLAGEISRWVAATEDGEVVGHLAATPLYYRINGRRVVAHSPGDYMGHPDYGFHALMLMRKFFSACENCVSLDMVPEVIGVQAKFGAVDAGQLQYAAKLLNVSRLPMPGPVERLLRGGEGRGVPEVALRAGLAPVARDGARGAGGRRARGLRRGQDRLRRPGRLRLRPGRASGSPRRGAGAAPGERQALAGGGGPHHPLQVRRFADRTAVFRPVAARLLPPQRPAQHAHDEVRRRGAARAGDVGGPLVV